MRPAIDALPGFPRQTLTEDELLRLVRGIEVPATVEGPWGALVNHENGVARRARRAARRQVAAAGGDA